jgi:hypothetical protein
VPEAWEIFNVDTEDYLFDGITREAKDIPFSARQADVYDIDPAHYCFSDISTWNEWSKFLVYSRPMTSDAELIKILRYVNAIEPLLYSDGAPALDVDGNPLYVRKEL